MIAPGSVIEMRLSAFTTAFPEINGKSIKGRAVVRLSDRLIEIHQLLSKCATAFLRVARRVSIKRRKGGLRENPRYRSAFGVSRGSDVRVSAFVSKLLSFARHDGGNIAGTFAVSFLPLLAMVGAAVDYGQL